METVIEFELDGSRCRVIPEDITPGLDGNGKLPVVGHCKLAGKAYLIVCTSLAPDCQPGSGRKVADLLTRRELQVALMVSQGLVNKQIADRLRLSPWTVSSYLRRCFNKLGVRSRAAMVARILGDMRG